MKKRFTEVSLPFSKGLAKGDSTVSCSRAPLYEPKCLSNKWHIVGGVIASCFLMNAANALAVAEEMASKYGSDGINAEFVFDNKGNLSNTKGSEYTLDGSGTNNEISGYPRRWSPFRKGTCNNSLKMITNMRMFGNGERMPVTYSSRMTDGFEFSYLNYNGNKMYFQADCAGHLFGVSAETGRTACISVEDKNKVMLYFSQSPGQITMQCNKFRYIPVKERSCAGVIQSELSSSSLFGTARSPVRIFMPMGKDDMNYPLSRRSIDRSLSASKVLDGDLFDFSSENAVDIPQEVNPTTGNFMHLMDDPYFYHERAHDSVGFHCYEAPMVYEGGESFAKMGELSHEPCDKQEGCMWESVTMSSFTPVIGQAIPETVASMLSEAQPDIDMGPEALTVEMRIDGPLIPGSSGDPFWRLARGSRIRSGDMCLTTDVDAMDIKFEPCDHAGLGRYYVPVAVSFPDRSMLRKESYPFNTILTPCLGYDSINSKISFWEHGLGTICDAYYSNYQKAQNYSHNKDNK